MAALRGRLIFLIMANEIEHPSKILNPDSYKLIKTYSRDGSLNKYNVQVVGVFSALVLRRIKRAIIPNIIEDNKKSTTPETKVNLLLFIGRKERDFSS